MSDAAIVAIVTGVPAMIGAVVAAIVSLAALRKTNEAAAVTTATLLVVAKDTEAIKGHVNSEKSISEGEKITLKRENAMLREQIADEKVTRQLLAQAAALVPALAVVPGLPAAPEPVLDQIESNTADTAKNTARTEAKVTTLAQKVP